MNCCQCQGIESLFDKRRADADLTQYRRDGPSKTTRWLLDALKSEGVEGMTLLDIGGGVGAVQHELLQAGVRQATAVDASSAYLRAAREEASRQGRADRVNYHFGNFVDLAPTIGPADIVTLDRVICCYHDMEALVSLSAERARRLYGLVYPRDTWWLRVASYLPNAGFWLMRNPFRIFVHSSEAVNAILRAHGLKQRFYRQTMFWQVNVYSHM